MNDKEFTYIVEGEAGSEGAESGAPWGERRGTVIEEAADLYGDIATAEEYGYVERALKARHIQFIALGGTIGTGLFVGIAKALHQAGPLGILLGYSVTGIFIYMMMQCLGEMVTWLPLPGAIPQMAARYADPALGFAVGWNQWYANALTQCVEIAAAATVISYWEKHDETPINPAAWITIFIVVIVSLNIVAVGIYGEAEFCFASIKIITILGLIILAFIIDLGGTPRHHRLGFQYWSKPGALPALAPATGDWGRFLAFFTTLINASYAYGGVETVAVAAGEAQDPRRNIPKAVRRVFWRILFFYVMGSLAIGVIVPYTKGKLTNDTGDARSSPWVIGIKMAQIDVLPSIINAVILTSAASSANSFLYSGSRFLFAIAQNGQAPSFLLRCSKRGLPWVCVAITASFSLLTYLTVASGPARVFNWFYNLTTIANLFTWWVVCLTSIRFRAAIKAQGVDPSSLPFRSWGQPYLAWAGFVFFSIVIVFNGFNVFMTGNWKVEDFIVQYIGMPIFFLLWLFWKVFRREPFVKAKHADIWTGKAAVDAEYWPERIPRNIFERIWFWIA